MLGSILKQLASLKSPLPSPVVELYKRFGESGGYPHVEDLGATLLLVCQEFLRTFIIIDSLDECDAGSHGRSFLEVLQGLQRQLVRVFITSQPHPDQFEQVLLACPQITLDVSAPVVRQYLTERIQQGDAGVDFIDELLQGEIVRGVTEGAQGMLVGSFSATVTRSAFSLTSVATVLYSRRSTFKQYCVKQLGKKCDALFRIYQTI
jgi:hypothetical protein